jgi:outer membrane biosynthesis protein TonB
MSQSIVTARSRISLASEAGAARSGFAWIGSLVLHAAIIGATLFTFSHSLDIADQSPPMIPVDLVTIGQKTNIAPRAIVQPKAPPAEAPVPPTPTPMPAQPSAPQQQASSAPPPEPAPSVEPIKAPPQPQVKPKPQPAKPDKKDFNVDNVLALLNKVAPAAASAPNARPGTRNVKGVGAMNAMTADLQDALRSQIAACWSPPVGAPKPEELVVDFDLLLNTDGSVAQPPQLVGQSASLAASDPYTRAAADSARRAIYECAPYKLPADRYSQWREINPFHFDPRAMMGQ